MEDKQKQQLVRLAKNGNKQALEQLFLMEKEYLYKMAYLYMKNNEDALDVVQDCIVRCVVSIETLRDIRYFRTWITRILIRCAQDEWRRKQRYQNVTEWENITENIADAEPVSREGMGTAIPESLPKMKTTV